jgi:hypothetical protein
MASWLAVDNLWGYAIAGYVLTGTAIGLYVLALLARARRARDRALAIGGKRRGSSLP